MYNGFTTINVQIVHSVILEQTDVCIDAICIWKEMSLISCRTQSNTHLFQSEIYTITMKMTDDVVWQFMIHW